MIEIIQYTSQYKNSFKAINLEWLDGFGLTESHDLQILNDPEATILKTGGSIFLAKSEDEIVGTAAIIYEGNDMFELAKMAVVPAFQGKGISKLLLQKCINEAKQKGGRKMILFSNSRLKTALSLYEKNGFHFVDPEDSPFETADIKMELYL